MRKALASVVIRRRGNHGAYVTARRHGQRRTRWVPPGGGVRITIAAAALRTNAMKLYRLIRAGELEAVKGKDGRWTISLAELARMKRPGALRDRRRPK